MIIPDKVRKCVAFVGYRANDQFRMAGSVFFLGHESADDKPNTSYAITARHVIDGLKKRGLSDAFLRLNLADGSANWFRAPLDEWFSHPSDSSIDVAICQIGLDSTKYDHLVLSDSMCITELTMREQEIGLGDEVFVVGLFTHHHGNRRNIPIVRVGNLVCLTEEKVVTSAFGEIDAYLIEARSTGGLSGSPVFLNLGATRMIAGEVKHAQGAPIWYLLGLMHGHYDDLSGFGDEFEIGMEDHLTPARANTGIAIVVPWHKINEVIVAFERR